MSDERHCLHCDQTKAQVRRDNTICGIEGGYEYRELEAEWPHHRWADWTDRELDSAGVKPEAFDRHRRTLALDFQWIGCDDTVRGHRPSSRSTDLADFGTRPGQCILCGQMPTTREDQTHD